MSSVVSDPQWYTERYDMWPGINAVSIKIEKVLHKEKSPYQDILIFKR